MLSAATCCSVFSLRYHAYTHTWRGLSPDGACLLTHAQPIIAKKLIMLSVECETIICNNASSMDWPDLQKVEDGCAVAWSQRAASPHIILHPKPAKCYYPHVYVYNAQEQHTGKRFCVVHALTRCVHCQRGLCSGLIPACSVTSQTSASPTY